MGSFCQNCSFAGPVKLKLMSKKLGYEELKESLDASRNEVDTLRCRLNRLKETEADLQQMRINAQYLQRLVEVLVEALEARRPKP